MVVVIVRILSPSRYGHLPKQKYSKIMKRTNKIHVNVKCTIVFLAQSTSHFSLWADASGQYDVTRRVSNLQ